MAENNMVGLLDTDESDFSENEKIAITQMAEDDLENERQLAFERAQSFLKNVDAFSQELGRREKRIPLQSTEKQKERMLKLLTEDNAYGKIQPSTYTTPDPPNIYPKLSIGHEELPIPTSVADSASSNNEKNETRKANVTENESMPTWARAMIYVLQNMNQKENQDDSHIPILWGNMLDNKGNPAASPISFFAAIENFTQDNKRRASITYRKSSGVARVFIESLQQFERTDYFKLKNMILAVFGANLDSPQLRKKISMSRREKGETLGMFGTRLKSLGSQLLMLDPQSSYFVDGLLIDALKTALPETCRGILHDETQFDRYWTRAITLSGIYTSWRLGDEDILKEEGPHDRNIRLTKMQNIGSPWNCPSAASKIHNINALGSEEPNIQNPTEGTANGSADHNVAVRRVGNTDRRNVTCYRCKRQGHYANECKQLIPPRQTNIPQHGNVVQCFNCKGYGHLKRDCPSQDFREGTSTNQGA